MVNRQHVGYMLIETSNDIALRLAKDFKRCRKKCKISQKRLAVISGVSYSSIKRFEQTGQISFVSLLDIARAINKLEDFDNLFKEKDNFRNIQDVIDSWKK